ncbi:MAG TPA: efflux RND transporter periplasmic adaptor subunit [Desulfobacteraceae bacterium]|nr:efflux RND transporter periplasmic adaptor subunit [Deltaproteobacteria bacterium]HDI59964.1 efflux RND transporter periplasmic adaptor subunit [Desulfobacteraceae bacterium]
MMGKCRTRGIDIGVWLGLWFAVLAVDVPLGYAQEGTEAVFDGLIEPYLVVEVGSEVSGVLDSVKVDRGDMVKAGQVVATLSSRVERANLKLARARAQLESTIKLKQTALEFARRNSQRAKEVYDAKALAFQKWDEVETQRIMAENELAEALEQKQLHQLEYQQAAEVLRRKTILSPVSGVLMERHLSKGEYVEDKPIVKIAQIDPLNVEVILPVSQLGAVEVGMKAVVMPEEPVGGEHEATVTIVDKVIDAASGTFGVRLELPNPEYAIAPGLKCKVRFQGT